MEPLKQIILTAILLAISSCAEVKPWRKEHLAARHMRFDPEPLESKFIHHIYQSKEGSFGGYGIGGGGCGCN